MRLESLTVDRSQSPAGITFGPGFNAAVPFIDRHLAEGRGAKVAIRSAAGEVTYAQLAERVSRCGTALLGLGVRKGDRLLLVVKDCPEFFYLFWGAIKAGILPVPLNTLLRAADYRFILEDSQCSALVWSPEYEGEVKAALAAARPRPAVALPVEGGDGTCAPSSGARAPSSRRRPRRRPPRASGSTRPARRAARRAPSTATGTWWRRASTTASACSASATTTCSSPPRSCSSRTGTGTR